MFFNMYYLNFSKVYEIKMMLSNITKTSQGVESSKESENNAKLGTSAKAEFLGLFKAEANASLSNASIKTQKVIETFQITDTKSIFLSEVLERSFRIENLQQGIEEGILIQIDNVRLVMDNEEEIRQMKMLTGGIFKGLQIPEIHGLDLNNLLGSFTKDYSYKLIGTLPNNKEKILIKIPLTYENEFESQYSVDDLLLGQVSIIGIYKDTVQKHQLKNTFAFFQEYGKNDTAKSNNTNTDCEIRDSQSKESQTLSVELENNSQDNSYHYIDLLAIIQTIKTNVDQ